MLFPISDVGSDSSFVNEVQVYDYLILTFCARSIFPWFFTVTLYIPWGTFPALMESRLLF